MNHLRPAIQSCLQLAAILLACRCLGKIARRLGQPQVVAEMLAGICLGPSLFGLLWPEAQEWLFPWGQAHAIHKTQRFLYPASQIGLVLYMFVVGMEFRMDVVQKRLRSAVVVSFAGILAPLLLGAGLAWAFFLYTDFFPPRISLPVAMLFMGAAMSITAFPVLARIIQFKKLTQTSMGTVALGAGAIDDAAAWCLLALLFASVKGQWRDALRNMSGGLAYVVAALWLVRPTLTRAERWLVRRGNLTIAGWAGMLGLMSVGAWFTDLVGMHAVFGAFIMGAAMPRGVITRDLIRRIQPPTVLLLLPLFFAYSGLNTKVNLLNTASLWLACGAVLVVAVLGKGGACWVAARATGIPNREALGVGTLMNARGLMELIILNIGLERGLISEGLFTVLVIMAVTTTLMTSPVFDLLVRPGHSPMIDEPEALIPMVRDPQLSP